MSLTGVSLFAGVGGIDLAMENAGIDVKAAVEIDVAARGVLADRFPNTTLFNDVTEVTGDQLRAAGFVPERGILTAGFPCQDLSVAGRRKGMGEGTRSGLYWRGSCVGGCIPVHGGVMGAVLGSLGDLGYGFAYRVLDAQFTGVPQRRRRVFIVGHLGDDRRPVEVLLEPKGSSGNPPQSRRPGQGVAATLTAGIGSPGGAPAGRRQEDDVNLVVAPTLTARYGKGTDSDATDAIVVSTLQGGSSRTPDRRRVSSGGTPHRAEEKW